MNKESMALALTGAVLGVMVLSAAAIARLRQPEEDAALPAALAGEAETLRAAAPTVLWEDAVALPVLAEREPEADNPQAGPYRIPLRSSDPVPGERLFVCDGLGCPLMGIEPDPKGTAILEPLAPGSYSVQRGQTEVGVFRLGDDASLEETGGRIWTDGQVLYLERFTPGEIQLSVTLRQTGYFTLGLCDRDGRIRNQDIYISEETPPDGTGTWVRVLRFRGLPPGLYTAVRRNQPLGQTEVQAGQTAELEIEIASDN